MPLLFPSFLCLWVKEEREKEWTGLLQDPFFFSSLSFDPNRSFIHVGKEWNGVRKKINSKEESEVTSRKITLV